MQNAHIHHTRDQIKHTEVLIKDQISLHEHLQEQHIQAISDIKTEKKSARFETRYHGDKHSKMIEILTRKNQANNSQSTKRHLLLQWLRYTKNRKASVRAIVRTSEKSFWKTGFQEIQAFSRDKDLTRKQNTCLKGMSRMFWRKACGQQFQAWRDAMYTDVKQVTKITLRETVLESKNHDDWKGKV